MESPNYKKNLLSCYVLFFAYFSDAINNKVQQLRNKMKGKIHIESVLILNVKKVHFSPICHSLLISKMSLILKSFLFLRIQVKLP